MACTLVGRLSFPVYPFSRQPRKMEHVLCKVLIIASGIKGDGDGRRADQRWARCLDEKIQHEISDIPYPSALYKRIEHVELVLVSDSG